MVVTLTAMRPATTAAAAAAAAAPSSSLSAAAAATASNRPFACRYCDYRASTAAHVRRHERVHTGEKPYACQHCDYRATTSAHVRVHERTHTGEKPFACRFCSFRAIEASNVTRHERIHTGDKPFACRLEGCAYKTSRASQLLNHEMSHAQLVPLLMATVPAAFACTECEHRDVTAQRLKLHLKNVHGVTAARKPYACDRCAFSATEADVLEVHSRVHTSATPYVCKWAGCEYTTKRVLQLAAHERRTHASAGTTYGAASGGASASAASGGDGIGTGGGGIV
jgi:KRAB domain-containing zinc finger protein